MMNAVEQMQNPEDVLRLVGQLVGLPCTRVENPRGSILSIDLGDLGSRPGDTVSDRPHGWRHLTVLAPWRIESNAAVLCDWNVEGGASGRIVELAASLVGKGIVAAATSPPGWDLRLDFDGGITLVVFGDATVDRDDAWFILGTDGAEGAGTPVWASEP